MSIAINDITPLDQFIATNLQTVFNVTWTSELTTDVRVYARATGTTSSDINDIIAPADYTVAFIGGTLAVRVTFAVGRTTGDIVTITRDTTCQRENLYINTNFTPTMLNSDFALSTFIQQQNQMYNDAIGPRYNISATLAPTVLSAAPNPGNIDRILPILPALTLWAKNAGDTAIEALAVPAGGIGPKDATFITQTPSTDLDNEQAMSLSGTGFVTNTTATGVLNTRVLSGTTNQIDISNADGAGTPVWTLSSTINAPGTFTIQGSIALNAILDEDNMISNSATAGVTQQSVKAFVDNSFTTKVPLTTKGDLLGFNTGNARVPIGTVNGQMLQVASGDALGLAWSTATYPTTATNAGRILRADGTNYVDSTTTFADTYAASSLLYSNGANTVTGLATANSATIATDASGVPAMTASMTNGQVLIGSTGATPTPKTLTAGAGITIGNTAGTITITSGGGGYSWTDVTATSITAAANNGYVLDNAGLVTVTLPVTADFGDTFMLQGKGAGLYKLAQNAGQVIHFGSFDTTTGTGGSIEATNQYDSIELICITANTDWAVLTGPQGSLTIV